jgi:hypothetical protein
VEPGEDQLEDGLLSTEQEEEVVGTPPGLQPPGESHSSSVADPGCLSRIRLFSIPDPGYELSPSRILIKEFTYFNPKKSKKMVSKL